MDWGEFFEQEVFDAFFAWIVPGVSLMLLGLVGAVAWLVVAEPTYAAIDLALPTLFVALILWQGRKFNRSALEPGQRRTVAIWYAMGIYTMVGLAGWVVLLEALGQAAVPRSVQALTQVVAGGLFGLLVGVAQVRSERSAETAAQAKVEQEFIERQQETNEVLNRILRHHLLNGLTVIRGQTEVLEEHVDGDGEAHVETVLEQANDMAATIEEIRDITRTLTEEPELSAVDLGAVLDDQLARLRETYPEATVEVRGADPHGCRVAANDLLGRAVWNVLANAVEHNTAATPRVSLAVEARAEATVLTIADNGPGITDEVRERAFEPSERGLESDGEGLGLFLTRSVIEQYGGAVWIADEPAAADGALQAAPSDGGNVVGLELPRA
ncbi:MAG: ATP-binding protein [Haloarculaceae archaeon]